jgi:hypothetical protein
MKAGELVGSERADCDLEEPQPPRMYPPTLSRSQDGMPAQSGFSLQGLRDSPQIAGCYLGVLVGECLMMIAVQATYFVLKRWNQNSAADKRQIGIWQHWKEKSEQNDCPLSEGEVKRMKAFLKQHAPTSYSDIFAEEND